MAKTVAAQRKVNNNVQKQISQPCRQSAAVAELTKRRQPPVCSLTLEREARSFDFDANEYLNKGYTVLRGAVLSKSEVLEAREVALRIRAASDGGGGGSFSRCAMVPARTSASCSHCFTSSIHCCTSFLMEFDCLSRIGGLTHTTTRFSWQ